MKRLPTYLSRPRRVPDRIVCRQRARRHYERKDLHLGNSNDAADRNHLQVRNEGAVLLEQGVMTMGTERKSGCTCQRLQPDHGRHGAMLSRQRGDDAKAQLSGRARCRTILRVQRYQTPKSTAQRIHSAESSLPRQNLYPAPRPMMLLPAGRPMTGELSRCRYSSENSKIGAWTINHIAGIGAVSGKVLIGGAAGNA